MVRELGMLVALVAVCAAIYLSNDVFLGPTNVSNTSIEIARLGIFAIGVAFVIITGGIDLSVGSMITLTGVLVAKISSEQSGGLGYPIWIGVTVAFVVALVFGYLQGTLITRLGLQPFIVTLGGMLVFKGIARVLTNNGTLSFGDSPLPAAMERTLLRVGDWTILSTPTLILIIVVILATYLLHFTVFGRYLYAIGGGREAAEFSGIPVKRVETMAYVISAGLAALTGLVETRLSSMTHTIGDTYELYAIAAAVIGGVSLRGGEGSIFGVLIGAAMLRVIYNGINLFKYVYFDAEGRQQEFRFESKWQELIIGAVILLSVSADQIAHRLRAKRRARKPGAAQGAPPSSPSVLSEPTAGKG